ncbi:hypothetical protein ACCO45_010377 [Purpureocillium lilacinum]|uniref:Uncharacterized protein n=1 Tax=Purpureocillium lilacinum TaxID=33203 RepID=A0ACC4DES9_PURLI
MLGITPPVPPAQRRKSPSPRVKTQEDLRRPSPKRWAKKCGPPAIGSPPCRRTPDYCDWRPLQGRCRPQTDPSSPTAPAGEAPAVTVEAREAPQGPRHPHPDAVHRPPTGHPQAIHSPSSSGAQPTWTQATQIKLFSPWLARRGH